jgi:hypothetical protein
VPGFFPIALLAGRHLWKIVTPCFQEKLTREHVIAGDGTMS